MANCITTFEGKIVNLEHFDGFDIEQHANLTEMFQVKAHPTKNGSPTYPVNLTQGTKDECKTYIRDTLAPKLDVDTSDPHFIKFYGEAPKPAPKSKGRSTKKPADPPAEDSE